MVFRRFGQTLAVMLMGAFIVSCSVNPANGGSSVSSSSSSEASSVSSSSSSDSSESSISSSSSSSESSVSSSESSSSSSSVAVPDADPIEVSDIGTATISGALDSSSDENWYAFDIDVANVDLFWNVSCTTADDSDILTFYLYRQVVSGASTNLVEYGNNDGYDTGTTAQIVPVGTGTYTYYLKIVSYDGKVGEYTVNVWQDSPYGSILKRFSRRLLK